MSRDRVVLVGSGGHAADVYSLIRDLNECGDGNFNVLGVLVDEEFKDQSVRVGLRADIAWLGPPGVLSELDARFVIAVGYPGLKSLFAARLAGLGEPCQPLVHPRSSIGYMADLGAGAVVLAGASVSSFARIGRHSHVGQLVSVGHHCAVGELASLMPGCCISGDVSIGDRVMVGSNATILEGIRIGDDAVIGAGAVVTDDVPSGATVTGIPARVRGR